MISCLRGAGVEVIERHAGVWERRRHKWSLGLAAALRVGLAETQLLFGGRRERFDAVIVGYPGHFDVPAARRIARGRPLVFNPLVSLHDTLVEDRGRFGRARPRRASCARSTGSRFGAQTSSSPTPRSTRATSPSWASSPRTGSRSASSAPRSGSSGPAGSPRRTFHALFVGKLIPLHGLETILAAARLAPEVPFRIVGSGQLEPLLASAPPNVEWVAWVEYERLPEELQRAGCALGVFGTSAKAARVIPNKAFQALACGTPLVTADTPAARELLVDGESALLVPRRRPGGAGAAVRRLADDRGLARRIGDGGLAAYREHASEAVLGVRWRGLVEQLVAR